MASGAHQARFAGERCDNAEEADAAPNGPREMSALLHGKGCFNKLKRATDDEEVKPLFCATFIVKHPVCPYQQLQTSCIHAP